MSLFSVTTPHDILKHPLNNSPAKYHYSFSKTPRFSKNTSKYFLNFQSPVASKSATTCRHKKCTAPPGLDTVPEVISRNRPS